MTATKPKAKKVATNSRELANALNIKTVSTISRYRARGMPVNCNGTFNISDCKRWKKENVAPPPVRNPDKKAVESERVKTAQLKRRKLEGSLIKRTDLKKPLLPKLEQLLAALQYLALAQVPEELPDEFAVECNTPTGNEYNNVGFILCSKQHTQLKEQKEVSTDCHFFASELHRLITEIIDGQS